PPVEDTPEVPAEGVSLTIHVTQYFVDGTKMSETFKVVSPSAYFIDVCPNLCGESFEFTLEQWGYWMLDGVEVTPKTLIYDGCHLELYVTKAPDESGDSSESGSDSSESSKEENYAPIVGGDGSTEGSGENVYVPGVSGNITYQPVVGEDGTVTYQPAVGGNGTITYQPVVGEGGTDNDGSYVVTLPTVDMDGTLEGNVQDSEQEAEDCSDEESVISEVVMIKR
ncbi:MAG: hypothetical protein IJX13_01725, partial [Clostridia bacterium]|nr:hypothetical protein [Clostridia bacterium]